MSAIVILSNASRNMAVSLTIKICFHFRRNQQIQLNDSNCKLYLQPTAPTFDVHCSDNDEHPHIATISNNAIFYRAPLSNAQGCLAWELERYVSSLILALSRLFPKTVASSCLPLH